MRILPLLPSATEMLYALGLGRSVVGRSSDCDYPPQVKRKPTVVWSKVAKLNLSDSLKIHEAVLKLRRDGAHQFSIDLNRLKQLKPDLVITQNLCAVCAASHPEVSSALKALSPPPKVMTLQAQRLDEVFTDLRHVGMTTGRSAAAFKFTQQLQVRIERVQQRISQVSHRPRVWCCEWLEPLMAAGHWIPELVELAGGTDGLATRAAPSQWLTWQRIRSYDPEVIIVMPCSYSIPQIFREKRRLISRPGWKSLSAVKKSRVFAVQTSLFHRAGPRLIDGLELLAHLFHPGLVPAGASTRHYRLFV